MIVPIYDMKLNKDRLPYLCKVGETTGSKKIDGIKTATTLFNKAFDASNLAEEITMIICMDENMSPIGVFKVNKGSYKSTMISIRGIFQRCLAIDAKYFIAAHNHPSGDLKPSEQDIDVAYNLKTMGYMLEIPQIDNQIIAGDKYISVFDGLEGSEESENTKFMIIRQLLEL